MTAIVNARSKIMERRNAMLPNSREAIALRTFRQSISIRHGYHHHSSSSSSFFNSNPRTSRDDGTIGGRTNGIEYDSDSSSNAEGRIALRSRVVRVSGSEGRRTYGAPSA
mmetsp:Transcript_3302/g.7353  ORF Transcript_3302/g.7353 Transcript_3302/m.7353 type:complete len:110 (+) Transcript_3302:169-498(+)